MKEQLHFHLKVEGRRMRTKGRSSDFSWEITGVVSTNTIINGVTWQEVVMADQDTSNRKIQSEQNGSKENNLMSFCGQGHTKYTQFALWTAEWIHYIVSSMQQSHTSEWLDSQWKIFHFSVLELSTKRQLIVKEPNQAITDLRQIQSMSTQETRWKPQAYYKYNIKITKFWLNERNVHENWVAISINMDASRADMRLSHWGQCATMVSITTVGTSWTFLASDYSLLHWNVGSGTTTSF